MSRYVAAEMKTYNEAARSMCLIAEQQEVLDKHTIVNLQGAGMAVP